MLKIDLKVRKILLAALALGLIVSACFFLKPARMDPYLLGAHIHPAVFSREDVLQTTASDINGQESSERFQRPSRDRALPLKFRPQDVSQPGTPPRFSHPEDVIKAYFAILKEAANMEGYVGGCGSIGMGKGAYPDAYSLLSADAKEERTLKQFEDSFRGIGHITLLKLKPAYSPKDTPEHLAYFFIEAEVITGPKQANEGEAGKQPSYFAYYYGLATVEHTASAGWKIESMDLIPEDFLCAPYHSWFWEARAVAGIVYQDWYQMIDKITGVDIKGSDIRLYAKGKGKEYRFDFVQLTNGHQLLLHENVRVGGTYQETNLLEPEDQVFKLSVLNPMLN